MPFTFRNSSATPVRLFYLQEGAWRVLDDLPVVQPGDDVQYGSEYLAERGSYLVRRASDGHDLQVFHVPRDGQMHLIVFSAPAPAATAQREQRGRGVMQDWLVGVTLMLTLAFAVYTLQ